LTSVGICLILLSYDDFVAGANRRWRCQFRYRGPRCESAVAQLFSLGHEIYISQDSSLAHWILWSALLRLLGWRRFGLE
jgi:hypothetical protein